MPSIDNPRDNPIIGADIPSPLTHLFEPSRIAVIGASNQEGSVGKAIWDNLANGEFSGSVYPVNPKYRRIGGRASFPSVLSIPQPVDLAVIATPAIHIPDIMRECGMSGIKSAIIISAGFGECGQAGIELERQVREEALHWGMRIVGPNCLGIMRPHIGLNASFAKSMALPGNVGFLSQSGALCTAVLDWSIGEQVGFSAVVSVGSMLDVDWGDLLDYLADDPMTKSIVLYMESIGNAGRFIAAARRASVRKPVIAIKAGRSRAGARAAASHTGALASNDAVLDAAFQSAGVQRVDRLADLFNVAEALAKQPRPGVLAADTLTEGGNCIATLNASTIKSLDETLPPQWSHANPIDVLGDAEPHRYARAAETVAQDPNVDGLLLLLTPQSMTDPAETARSVVKLAHSRFPVLAAWMGGEAVMEGNAILREAGIPTYAFPDTAARVFNHMGRQGVPIAIGPVPNRESAGLAPEAGATVEKIIEDARSDGASSLDAASVAQVLSAYGISVLQTRIASTAEETVAAAEAIGYPVALKVHSNVFTHKSDVGGVRLNVISDEQVVSFFSEIRDRVIERGGQSAFQGLIVQPMHVSHGYELILGSTVDPQFGPVLMFGSGGTLVEVIQDTVLGLPPISADQAREMMARTKIFKALAGFRGRPPVDFEALENTVARFSHLIVDQPGISEIDINPLLANEGGVVSLDARIILQPSSVDLYCVPKPALLACSHDPRLQVLPQ